VIHPRLARVGYRQIADELRESITSGQLGPGAWLPSITRLQQEHGVARVTVRRALELLEREGLVEVEPSYGTRVREVPLREKVPTPRGVSVISRLATLKERRDLGIPEGGHVLVVTVGGRIRGVYAAAEFELTIA
jgi:GntR family transcriptional regulator